MNPIKFIEKQPSSVESLGGRGNVTMEGWLEVNWFHKRKGVMSRGM